MDTNNSEAKSPSSTVQTNHPWLFGQLRSARVLRVVAAIATAAWLAAGVAAAVIVDNNRLRAVTLPALFTLLSFSFVIATTQTIHHLKALCKLAEPKAAARKTYSMQIKTRGARNIVVELRPTVSPEIEYHCEVTLVGARVARAAFDKDTFSAEVIGSIAKDELIIIRFRGQFIYAKQPIRCTTPI